MAEKDLIYETKKLMLAKYPRFASEIAQAKIEFNTNLKYHTAATDGKNIYVDPNYLESLDEDDRIFLLAHEIMHIKFKHALRLTDKEGKERDHDLWNEVTDAIINANLERDGFNIKEGYVNMPDALKYSAEELYEKLKKEQDEAQKDQNGQDGENGQNGSGNQSEQNQSGEHGQNGKNDQDENGEQGEDNQSEGQPNNQGQKGSRKKIKHIDDHSLWDKGARKEFEKQNKQESSQSENENTQKQEENKTEADEIQEDSYNEKEEFEKNRKEKIERAKKILEENKNKGLNNNEKKIELGEVGSADDIIDWKLLVRREVDKTETIWSQRRSIAENNYAYRLEENDVEDDALTEVMIDVSGSVSLDMVRAFLRQLKPLLRESKLFVGCFNEKYWGKVEIKSERDIDNFTIPAASRGSSACTENWDLAVRSFTKKREVNKIVFTDGIPCPGTMPKSDLKNENVIWIVYDNFSFSPCCGKVIKLNKNELMKKHTHLVMKEPDEEELEM